MCVLLAEDVLNQGPSSLSKKTHKEKIDTKNFFFY